MKNLSWQFSIGLLAAGVFYALSAWVWNWALAFNVAYHDVGTTLALVLVGGVMFGVAVALMTAGKAQRLFVEVTSF